MKPKAQTLQQKMGFSDPDLTTPKHDQLMLLLDKWIDGNMFDLISLSEPVIRVDGGYAPDTLVDVNKFKSMYPNVKLPSAKIIKAKKIWEQPILDRSYTIGFADILCVIEHSENGGFYDPRKDKFQVASTTGYIFFEVKPAIPSLGEVIRQIRMYQTYTNRLPGGYDRWYIVSPDDRFRDQIESQGIGFIHVENVQ